MELTHSDRLKLRVDALGARLHEVSVELSARKGQAFQAREQLEAMCSQALMEGRPRPAEAGALESDLQCHESAIPALEEQEVSLKKLHLEARRDHLRKLREERPSRWLILE